MTAISESGKLSNLFVIVEFNYKDRFMTRFVVNVTNKHTSK